jgi:DNA polymerase
MHQIPDEVRCALRDRFEADLRFGIGALPIGAHAPAGASGPAASQSSHSQPASAPARPPVGDAELSRRRAELKVLDDAEVKGCRKCGLHHTRTKTVFGVGNPNARIMFIGEAPGHDEDVSGEPFVGRAGQLLNDMITKGMGLRREDVYICNVLKCRPPENRNPAPDEIIACKNYLLRQIEIVNPEVIVTLGLPATQTLLNTHDSMSRLRNRWHAFYTSGSALIGEPIPVMPTYHPAYLLRTPGDKNKAWADLKLVMARLGIPIPARGGA